MKELIAEILQKSLKEKNVKIEKEEIINLLETPPSLEMGDYAFPCFFLVNEFKEEPDEIAIQLRAKIGNPPPAFEDIQTVGPYINFFVDRKIFAENLVSQILKQKNNFGKLSTGKGNKTMVEFPSPNTNKPLHLGHLRNMSLGESVSRILEFNGEKVIRANLNNDRGIHICKSMLAYQKYGRKKKPAIKSDHFVGDYYVLFNKKLKKNKKLEKEAHDLLRKWEEGDKETRVLWSKMNKWALDGFNETYKKFGIAFDKEYYESKIYKKGREIIMEGVKKGIFKKEKKAGVTIKLNKEKLKKKFLLRPDGTSVYITQDIYLAKLKSKQFKLTKSIYVTGNEQDYHFNILFLILKKLGVDFSNNLYHLSYGMVNLPEGKMKSREGNVVDADDLIEKVKSLVEKELKSREKLSKKELESRSLKIAMASIKYFLLKVGVRRDMVFNPKDSINFEGDTGPYMLYSYARAGSILRKIKSKNKQFKIEQLNQTEIKIIKKLSQFPEVVLNAYNNFNPSLIANYSYQLAQIFNEFYHACPVIGSEQESFRLALVKSFKQVLENSLNLLGIETLEKM
ncbi:arginine--tRNA ligase [Candidatus Pacearchaeota archaeon]|nr:arginine--tRNA ligase [Candidatus Pacearchaeota archaeon]